MEKAETGGTTGAVIASRPRFGRRGVRIASRGVSASGALARDWRRDETRTKATTIREHWSLDLMFKLRRIMQSITKRSRGSGVASEAPERLLLRLRAGHGKSPYFKGIIPQA